MSWFKVDDALALHTKTVAAGNAAMGLWVRAGSWSSQQLTGGFIPQGIAQTLGTAAQASALVSAGLWRTEGNGYRFHDWEFFQPSADDEKAFRAAKHEVKVRAGRAGGLASGHARRSKQTAGSASSTLEANGEANGKQNEAPTRPDPIETPLVSPSRKRTKPKTPPPDDMLITPEMAEWGRQHAPLVIDPKAETVRFLDHARANGKSFTDWTAAWRTWMGNAQRFTAERSSPRAGNPAAFTVEQMRGRRM